jgi:MacB-like periplasmic core domain
VILTCGYWRRRFGADRGVVGRTVIVDGKSRQIVGVMPQRFHFLDWDDPAIILPIQLDRNKVYLGQFSYEAVARLKPGVTLAQANADVARMIPTVWRSFSPPTGARDSLRSGREPQENRRRVALRKHHSRTARQRVGPCPRLWRAAAADPSSAIGIAAPRGHRHQSSGVAFHSGRFPDCEPALWCDSCVEIWPRKAGNGPARRWADA